MGKLCCDGKFDVGLYKPLSQVLVDFGNECFAKFVDRATLMWMFIFYDGDNDCPKCRSSLAEIHDWFYKKGLLDSSNYMVKIVVEPEPDKCKVYKNLGFTLKPMHIFCDPDGKIFDIFTGLPDSKWLDKHIYPYIQKNIGMKKVLSAMKEQ